MSISRSLALLTASSLALLASCSDDAGSGGADSTATSTSSSPTTGTSPQTGTGTMSTTQTGPTTGTGGMGQGGAPDCSGLPMGPITPNLETDQFNGSEDLAFDGAGNIVGKQGGQIVAIDANDTVTTLAMLAGQSYGLRYGITGDLFVARPNAGTVVAVDPAGNVTDFATGFAGANGVYPDFAGNVWVTDIGGNTVERFDAGGNPTTIASGVEATAPNGVVFDEVRNLAFFTNYIEGILLSVDPSGAMAPVEVGQVNGANLDGIVLDACGNVYAVDQGNSRLYRFDLDPAGALIGMPVLLADFPTNVANAQFGSGAGWDAETLYVAGNPGDVYSVVVGVAGAPVPTPP